MRSFLVYAASTKLPNRFQLCQTTAKALRKLHVPATAPAATINKVLEDIAASDKTSL